MYNYILHFDDDVPRGRKRNDSDGTAELHRQSPFTKHTYNCYNAAVNKENIKDKDERETKTGRLELR